MSVPNKLRDNAMVMLKETSRTFFIPISHLPAELQDAVGSAYLCMRAIDEIEDHPELEAGVKSRLLYAISDLLKKSFNEDDYMALVGPYQADLPDVTLQLGNWIALCPTGVADQVLDATSIMAKGMADWVEKDWHIQNEADLDDYTFYVAGLVGVMLNDIWKWYDGTDTDKELAIAFGRGLQSVNILRNTSEDSERGVSFFPNNWSREDMFAYARRNLSLGKKYLEDVKSLPILHFCKIPLALADGTLNALMKGKEKMTRDDVNKTVSEVVDM
ncbi:MULTISPECIES: squalene/phytoene synthase family protein [Priestia]|uniref:Phytoene/squalene synthase family protein n=2 Tax=Priestia TaxID=2800373 RepID=A0AAX6BNQ5_PRIMG|nr:MULTISPECIES: phytoene/squalene synthase family protein [Priestia]MBK0293998.1 phytoene/squalene synthase family protein [Bacillus sp. S34]UPK51364.1 phytoene/squalene synthase family protein [Bacillus sp. H8-1]AWD63695.1 phytoene/squalene synthase family protein [Priestia megaterium]MBY0209944.1 phytoene/squalene synthase family protein [Priestia aryabhattai]MDC7765683.1 phytoene/squalene synthase family protein [Priestia aryabhattai]